MIAARSEWLTRIGSGVKVKAGVCVGASNAQGAFRLATQGCYDDKHALGAFSRRIRARAGGPMANLATAWKLAECVYRLLPYGEQYVYRELAVYGAAYQARRVKGLTRKASKLRCRLERSDREPGYSICNRSHNGD